MAKKKDDMKDPLPSDEVVGNIAKAGPATQKASMEDVDLEARVKRTPEQTMPADVPPVPIPPPPGAPDPWTVLDRLTKAMEGLAVAQQAGGGGRIEQMLEILSSALARVAETQLKGSQLIADETRRA